MQQQQHKAASQKGLVAEEHLFLPGLSGEFPCVRNMLESYLLPLPPLSHSQTQPWWQTPAQQRFAIHYQYSLFTVLLQDLA